ncbi:MAG: Type pilus biosis protein PilQ [Labilithrix sp.]|nr:Type pilus biosis protein PilQ [Labilithrix sp.]
MRAAKRGLLHKRVLSVLGATALVLSATLSWADGAPNHVRDVKIRAVDTATGSTEIEVVGTTAPVFNVRVESGGKRLLVDIANSDAAGVKDALTSQVGVVGGVLTQAFKTEQGMMTRLSVSLVKQATYRVRAEGTSLKVTLTPSSTTAAATAADVKVASAVEAASVLELSDVRFEKGKNGADRLRITTSGVPSYSLGTTPGGRVRLELKKTQLPKSLARITNLATEHSPLKAFSATYDPGADSTVIEIDRDGMQQGSISVEGNSIVWTFDAPKAGVMGANAVSRKSVTVARERSEAEGPKIETSIRGDDVKIEIDGTASETAGFASSINGQAGRFSGRRIDLDLKDADIHNILRLLADVGRVNIVTADDVAGNVTIRMRNVPWDQALDVVLQAKGLGMVRSGNLIRVAPMATLQKERELRLAAAKQEYELTPLETRLIPVSYALADELQARAKDLLSPRGSIAVDERTNVLIARDIVGNLNNIEELIRSLDTQTPQVLVEARIVEATSRYIRDIGIQWGGDATFSEATGNPTGIAFPSSVGVSGGNYDQNTNSRGLSPFQGNVSQPNFAVNLPAATGTGQGGAIGFSLGSIDNNFNVGLRLSAAEASGLLRIVSSPRILTLDNRDARISQGTLIPFSQVSAQGVQTTFQEAKLQLLVRPHVTADGSVSMHVKINRDEPDFNQTSARGDPTILKREAETDLLVMDGHTAVIGGIYTRNTGRNLDQVPFFGDIPVLGILFQRRRASDTRNELVIFLTPRIVNRAEALGR